MNVVAVIIEQLEPDGRIKRLVLEGLTPRFEIAFPDEFVGERSGPFFFPNPDHEKLFEESFADCEPLKLARDSFHGTNGNYTLTIERGGIPTERGGLSYYSLTLPEYAVPRKVVVTDPRSGRPLFKSVYKDKDRNCFVIYIECSSRHGLFDFVLEIRFMIGKKKFGTYVYEDERQDDFLNKYGMQLTSYPRGFSLDEQAIAREFFSGDGEKSHKLDSSSTATAEAAGNHTGRASLNGHALTANEVAAILNMHPVTVYKLASSGQLPCFKIGYSLRFRRDQIEAFMKSGGSRGTNNGAR